MLEEHSLSFILRSTSEATLEAQLSTAESVQIQEEKLSKNH
jgi:hypothetical protein